MQILNNQRKKPAFVTGNRAGGSFSSGNTERKSNLEMKKFESKQKRRQAPPGNDGSGGGNGKPPKNSRPTAQMDDGDSSSRPNNGTGDANQKKFDNLRQTKKSNGRANASNGNPGNGSGNNNNNNNGGNPFMGRKYRKNRKNTNETVWTEGTTGDGKGSTSFFSDPEVNTGTDKFAPGIRSGLITNSSQNSTPFWTPLLVMCGELFPPFTVTTTGQNYLFKVVMNDIYYECLRICQIKINRIIISNFTLSKWYTYMYTVVKALQLYFMYDSLRAYVQDSTNHNPAMIDIYNTVSAEGWANVDRLQLDLSKHYMKPEMVKFVHYMYQHFTPFYDKPGTILKLGWNDILNSGHSSIAAFKNADEIALVINSLNTSDNLEIAAYMSRGFEEWRIKEVPASFSKPIYDPNYLTFWTNSAISWHDGTDIHYSKEVSNVDDLKPYYLHRDDVDGMYYACNTIPKFISAGNYQVETGLWQPQTDYTNITLAKNKSSLLRYDNSLLVPYELAISNGSIAGGSGNAYSVFYNTTDSAFNVASNAPTGTKPVIVDNIANLSQACNDAFRYLLYPITSISD